MFTYFHVQPLENIGFFMSFFIINVCVRVPVNLMCIQVSSEVISFYQA